MYAICIQPFEMKYNTPKQVDLIFRLIVYRQACKKCDCFTKIMKDLKADRSRPCYRVREKDITGIAIIEMKRKRRKTIVFMDAFVYLTENYMEVACFQFLICPRLRYLHVQCIHLLLSKNKIIFTPKH